MEQKDNDVQYIKLDYTLKTAQERADFVSKLPEHYLNNKKYTEYLADYIVTTMTKEEKKKKEILTSNRMVTINKRETSYQGLVSKFENGEDGIYNLMINDKNVLLTPKISITEKDLEEMKPLRDLKDSISQVEKMEKAATGKKKFKLKKQLIEMHQEQYTIKNEIKQPMASMLGSNAGGSIKGFSKLDLSEDFYIDECGEPHSTGLINFFDAEHVCALLCNYSALKEDAWGKFTSDLYYMMEDLDNVVEHTLKDKYPVYYKLLIYKIDGKQNAEIQELLGEEFGPEHKHSVEYISSLWRNKIPKLIAEKAKEEYLE